VIGHQNLRKLHVAETIENARAKRGTVDNQVADLGFIRHWPAIASARM
jgi:hypothetical protein